MEIRWRLYFYVVVNCAYCVAKPVSLNEVIAAESQQKQPVQATSPKLEELAHRFSFNKGLKPLLRAPKKIKETDSYIPLGKKISSLKYRKTFQIKSPLRPKRMRNSLRRHNHKNQSVKREISGNEKLNQKYVPLLRSLSLLFNNLLAESSESNELRSKRKRVRYYTDTSEVLCPCSAKSNAGFRSEKAATAAAKALSAETSSPPEATPKTPHPPTASHFRGFRQNKNIPILLPRNTLSGRRDDNGFGKRGRSSYHGSATRNIARDHGDSEHGTGDGSHESDTTDDEEDSSSHTRDHVSSSRPWRRIRDRDTYIPRKHTEERNSEGVAIPESTATENETTLERPGGNLDKLEREDKQQIRRDEAESAELLSAPVGRLRGFLPAVKTDIPKSELEKSESHVKKDNSSDQQLIDGNGALAEENKETSSKHETVELYNIPTIRPERSKTEGPVVFIIDGYSVTRNKHGENKLKEKAIHIHSK